MNSWSTGTMTDVLSLLDFLLIQREYDKVIYLYERVPHVMNGPYPTSRYISALVLCNHPEKVQKLYSLNPCGLSRIPFCIDRDVREWMKSHEEFRDMKISVISPRPIGDTVLYPVSFGWNRILHKGDVYEYTDTLAEPGDIVPSNLREATEILQSLLEMRVVNKDMINVAVSVLIQYPECAYYVSIIDANVVLLSQIRHLIKRDSYAILLRKNMLSDSVIRALIE